MSTWILLRGLTREARHWSDFTAHLQAALPGSTILALDLLGNGRFHGQPSPLGIPAMVAQARQQLAEQGVAPPYHLLALSLGGMVAVSWAEAHPEAIAGCVLINSSFRGLSPWWERLRPMAWPALLRLVCTPTPAGREQIVFRLTSRSQPGDPPLWEDWARLCREAPVSSRNALRQLIAAARYQAPQRAPVPTLLLASARDGLVACRCSQRLAQRWGCALSVHPEAGHDLPLDAGPWVAQQVSQWLAEQAIDP